MASLNLRGSVTATHTGSANSVIVTKPTGVVENDIMFCVVITNTAYSNAVPSGWTSLGKSNPGYFYELFYKVAGASEGANYTWGFAASQKIKATMIAYQGLQFNHINPIDQVSNTDYVTSNTTNRAASMTVPVANSPLIFFGGVQDGSSIRTQTKPTAPTTDWVEEYDDGDTTAESFLEICSMIWTGSGATGNMDSTISATKTDKHAFAVSLNPPLGVTVTPSVITGTFSMQAPVVTGGAVVSPSVITASFTVQSPVVTSPESDITNESKHNSTFINEDKP